MEIDRFCPLHGNDIYLEASDKQVKAVCSNAIIAKELADIVNSKKNIDLTNNEIIEFEQAAICMINSLEKLQLKINDINTEVLSYAYVDFVRKFKKLFNIK